MSKVKQYYTDEVEKKVDDILTKVKQWATEIAQNAVGSVINDYLKKFTDKKMKMKLLKYCDWNYNDHAANFTNVTNIEIIME